MNRPFDATTNNGGNSYLGQYLLLEVIGRGSTSTVYKARQPSLQRDVAIKVLLPSLDPQFVARFEREARAIAQLQHPNILPIYDFGQQDGVPYLVMQYIPSGITLSDLLGGEPMEPKQALRIMIHLLSGLDYAHMHGIVHRDIKPSNVLLPLPTWPLLADFGIAKLRDDNHHLTPPGQTVGTAIYMAPERAWGRAADDRTDLYAAGVMLYEMLTGQVPFDGKTPMAVLTKHIGEPPPLPRSINPQLPSIIEPILLRALEKDPAARYQRADEMLTALEHVLALLQHPPAALPEQPASYLAEAPTVQVTSVVQPALAKQYETGKLYDTAQPPGIPVPPNVPSPRPGQGVPPPVQPSTNNNRSYNWLRKLALAALMVLLLAISGVALGLVRNAGTTDSATPNATAELSGATPQIVAALNTTDATTTPPVEPSPIETKTATAQQVVIVATSTPPALPSPTSVLPMRTPRPIEPVLKITPVPIPPTAPPTPIVVVVEPTVLSKPVLPTPIVVEQPPIVPGGSVVVTLEDDIWVGSIHNTRPWDGRTATQIYGVSTGRDTMTAAFSIANSPVGPAVLTVEGMDSEGPNKTPIVIRVNGNLIYSGPNPLPNDDPATTTGPWGSFAWEFPSSYLVAGRNVITINQVQTGSFPAPPWFMIDYARISFSAP